MKSELALTVILKLNTDLIEEHLAQGDSFYDIEQDIKHHDLKSAYVYDYEVIDLEHFKEAVTA